MPLIVSAGAVEGALLGAGQAFALARMRLPRRTLRRWPLVTSAAAVAAWSIGLLPSSMPIAISWTNPLPWLVAAVLAPALLLSIPLTQVVLLRSSINHASDWIWFNAAAWLVGISWTFAVSPLVDESSSMVRISLLYTLAGLLMAVTVAVGTGLCWRIWLARGDVTLAHSRVVSPSSR